MNRKILKYIIFILLPSNALAQKISKENELGQAIASNKFYTDSSSQQIFNFAKLSGYYLNTLMPERISKISVAYDFDKGNYIPSQGATSINAGKLSTEGTIKLGSVKLFGGFSYTKTFEDSTRFAHQTRNNITSPYYFGSPAYVHYERSVYDFQAMANKNFLHEKLSLSLSTNYKVGDHFSTNDPRGSIGEYQFNLLFSIGYKISDYLKLGVGYRHGYGQEKVTIGYKNPRYYESSSFPMYYNHLINGYGETKPILNDRRYNDNQLRDGLDLYIDINTNNFGKFYLFGNYTKENQRYFYANGSGFTDYAKYNLNTSNINMLWNKKLNNNTIGILAQYKSVDGSDYNLGFSANNYKYISNNLAVKAYLTSQVNGNLFNHFLKISKTDERRVDGIRANDLYLDNLNLSAGSNARFTKQNNHYFSLGLALNYKIPLNDTFNITQANEGYFTRYVIYYDYLYNTSSYIGGSIAGEYGLPIFKTMLASIKVNGAYMQKTDQKILNRAIVTSPGKDRFSSNISLNLYF
jgi:hypothetical protein